MSSKKNDAPGFNSLMASLGGKPGTPSQETTEITAQRNAAAVFGVCYGGAGQEKQNVKKDERSARREDIQSRLGISLGDTPTPKSSSSNIARAFGGTRSR